MPVFNVRSPDGQLFRVTAPEGATQEEIIQYAQSQMERLGESQPSVSAPQEGITAASSPDNAESPAHKIWPLR